LFNYEEVKAHSYILYYCGTMPTTTIYVSNPNPDLIYKWWTNNGNIVGTNTGVSINVNAPGTYYVSQQFDTLCPEHSRDSVTIMFDAICVVLDVNLVKFSSEQARNKNVILNWQATNNQLADSYELEYSTDGSTYQKLISYSSNADSGTVSYNFEHYVAGIKSPVINYRIKITGKTGQVKYSNIILQRLGNKPVNIPELYPNPASVSGKTFVAISSDTNDEATVTIKDIYGRTISIKKYNIKTGENTLLLSDINKLNPAMYIIQVKTSQVDYSQKVVIKN
ncbi:MAG: T9SS type A sorting domain-containing protein, partial [Ferruginibacter sp.]